MSSLREILQETMLGKASPHWGFNKLPFHPIEAQPSKDDDMIPNNPIWRFPSPAFGGPGVQLENVTCKVRGMNYMEMTVFNKVEWGPVSVKAQQLGIETTLPLADAYLIKCRYVPQGSIPQSSSGLWQLQANVDQSFEMIFGYEFPLGTGSSSMIRLSEEAQVSPNFTPDACDVSPTDPGSSKVCTLRLPSLRIVVCVSLVCCKERNDFEPGGVLGAGRVYPLIMVMANMPLDLVTASVKMARPTTNMTKMDDGELMVPDSVGAYFFADRNIAPLLPLPYWDNFFDYYFIEPKADQYGMVTRPKPGETKRTISGAVKQTGVFGSSLRDIVKQPGQGEFDNIHISPKMTFPKRVIEMNTPLTGLDRVTMAPFCVHDCFHMHWRWALWNDKQQNKGWDGNQPFVKAGAPLVPGNQEVSLTLHDKVTVTYTAKAQNVPAGEWQPFLHHGGAYALFVDWEGTIGKWAASLLADGQLMGDNTTWTGMYWHLRWGNALGQYERLTWTPQQFNKLREKSGAAAAAASAGG